MRRAESIHFMASAKPRAQEALLALRKRYRDAGPEAPDVIVAIGGDGFMLEAQHAYMGQNIPIYGMNRGTVAFLMNDWAEDDLPARLASAEAVEMHPLEGRGRTVRGAAFSALAINEVSLLRQTRQTAKLRIKIDGAVRMAEMIADGALVATPAGSTAYNFSAHGPIVPISARLLALTPISAFRPRRWRGALLRHDTKVKFEVIDPEIRPVSATADNREFRDIAEVEIREAADFTLTMLFDAGRALEERVLTEQFVD